MLTCGPPRQFEKNGPVRKAYSASRGLSTESISFSVSGPWGIGKEAGWNQQCISGDGPVRIDPPRSRSSERRKKPEAAHASLRKESIGSTPKRASPYMFATLYAGLGDKDRTFEHLEKAYRERCKDFALRLKAELQSDNLQSDPIRSIVAASWLPSRRGSRKGKTFCQFVVTDLLCEQSLGMYN
jgi:hypothetical protein